MNFIRFTVPPMPHYIMAGEDTYLPGRQHIARKNLGVFDLLIVRRGALYMGEGEEQWCVKAGEMLILSPNNHHYPTRPCTERTHFYWLHFQTFGDWFIEDKIGPLTIEYPITYLHNGEIYKLSLPKYHKISNPTIVYNMLENLLFLGGKIKVKDKQKEQILFYELLQHIAFQNHDPVSLQVLELAQQVSKYLEDNYADDINYELLSKEFNFHSVYLTRCMKSVYNCTPLDYLIKTRIEQAKKYLINTNENIEKIANLVGFNSVSYFSKRFKLEIKLSPSSFRKKYR